VLFIFAGAAASCNHAMTKLLAFRRPGRYLQVKRLPDSKGELNMRPLLTLGCVLLLLAPAAADGLLYRLPEDGTLIRYDFDFEASFGDDKKDTVKGTVT